ncbi:MAG TPA: class I SAM-dependent methyltransferase [Actinomycetota bacterium]|nr:class I SAM-dependent methyltransferase [Actinomycetota bacterium]
MPNLEQIKNWNEQRGPRWVRYQSHFDGTARPFGLAVMDRISPAPGERILDVGCGFGATSRDLAHHVGPAGEVVGVDISRPMLDLARQQAGQGITFLEADAQTADLGTGFDAAFSRFGVMFFDDPAAAFANICGALRPGGRLGFSCWQDVSRNPWMFEPVIASAPHLGMPDIPAPEAPGPFALADADRTRRLLENSGFTSVELEPIDIQLRVPEAVTAEQAAAILLQTGPMGQLYDQADPEAQKAALSATADVLRPYESAGGVAAPAAAWGVYGTRPDA